MAYHMTYQCFWNRSIYPVHRHMVAVVGCPAQSQFGQVAGTNYQTVCLVGDIHQHLGAFSGLTVFKRNAVVVKIMTDIRKMCFHGITDINGTEGNA